jgi:DNA-binding response OmpR family regulator
MSEQSGDGILLVEDDVEIRILLAEVLRHEKFNVFQAPDGEEAFKVFTEHQDKIALIITDLGLPKLGGVDLIVKVRAINSRVKIIGSSGYGRANIGDEVRQAGGDEFMPKPYVTIELIKAVKRLLSKG